VNYLVKQLVDDDGEIVEKDAQRWHLSGTFSGDAGMLCTGEFLDDCAMSSAGATYEFKEVKRGGITCKKCLSIVADLKAVKL
jgi:hypothetical protein